MQMVMMMISIPFFTEEVFLPKDVNHEHLDEFEKELEEFKRYVFDTSCDTNVSQKYIFHIYTFHTSLKNQIHQCNHFFNSFPRFCFNSKPLPKIKPKVNIDLKDILARK